MNLVDRVKRVLLQPKTEWEAIAEEGTTSLQLYKGYIIPLAAIGPIASFIGLSLVGVSIPLVGQFRMPVGTALSSSLIAFIMTLIGVLVIGLITNALAPTFNGEKNEMQALKIAAYASTPAWLAGIFQLLPALAILAVLISLYSLYLLYLGLPVLMKSPKEKSVAYTAVVVVCAIVVFVAIGAVTSAVGGLAGMPGTGTSLSHSSGTTEMEAKAKELANKMDAAAKKIEQAQKSGDTNAQMAAAGEMLGALAGGGVQYEPVDHAQLKAMLPAELAGFKRTQLESGQSGMAGINIANAEASFSDGDQRDVELSITDMGGGRGIGIAAAWAAGEQSRETENAYEKTVKVGDRVEHEEFDRSQKQGKFSTLIAKRFVVEARGNGVDMNLLRQAAGRIDVARLESMKEYGAKK